MLNYYFEFTSLLNFSKSLKGTFRPLRKFKLDVGYFMSVKNWLGFIDPGRVRFLQIESRCSYISMSSRLS